MKMPIGKILSYTTIMSLVFGSTISAASAMNETEEILTSDSGVLQPTFVSESIPTEGDSGTSGTADWTIDSNGVVTVGPGTLDVVGSADAWRKYAYSVKKIVFTGPEKTFLNADSSGLFREMPNLVSVEGTSNINTSNVTNMRSMFYDTPSLQTLDVSSWDTSNVTDMRSVFNTASSLKALDVSTWDTNNVTNMSGMFYSASSLERLELSAWNTSNLTDIGAMFYNTSSLQTLDVSNWDTSKVTNMEGTFGSIPLLTSLDVTNWNTSNVDNMAMLFSYLPSLTSLDLSNWDTRSVTDLHGMSGMFDESDVLSQLILGENTILHSNVWLSQVSSDDGFTGLWQLVGEGTPDNPTGAWTGTSDELITYTQSDGFNGGAFVWQPEVRPLNNPAVPSQDGSVITIPTSDNYSYQVNGQTVKGNITLTDGESITIVAVPGPGYAFPEDAPTQWDFSYTKAALIVDRISGPTRYETSLEVNKKTMIEGKPVFVVTGQDFPDALTVGPAATSAEGSLVLTRPDKMDQNMVDLIASKSPSQIHIIGGTEAVSNTVVNQLKSIAPIDRIGGQTRFDTSIDIYNKFFSEKESLTGALIATGWNYPDALSGSAAGGTLDQPVLLVNTTANQSIPAGTANSLKKQNVTNINIVGGTQAVPNSISNSLGKQFEVNRLSGETRYETNLAVNNMLNTVVGTDFTSVLIATGNNYPDALSAGVPAGSADQRLVLSNGTCIPNPVVTNWIKAPSSAVTNVTLVGGQSVLDQNVYNLNQCK